MKTLILCLLVFSPLLAFGTSDESTLEGAWLQDGVKWVNAPRDIDRNLQSGQAAIVYFTKDHKFAILYCTLYRVRQRNPEISHGDPRGVYQGEWKLDRQTVSISYQLVEATILMKGQKLPGPMQHAVITISQGPVLTFDRHKFRRAAHLDKSADEAVYGVRQSSTKKP